MGSTILLITTLFDDSLETSGLWYAESLFNDLTGEHIVDVRSIAYWEQGLPKSSLPVLRSVESE